MKPLREQVAQAIVEADNAAWEASGHSAIVAGEYEQADAAIRVVLAAVAEQIEALPAFVTHPYKMLSKDEVLAVLAQIGEEQA